MTTTVTAMTAGAMTVGMTVRSIYPCTTNSTRSRCVTCSIVGPVVLAVVGAMVLELTMVVAAVVEAVTAATTVGVAVALRRLSGMLVRAKPLSSPAPA
mgnify:CR=1 FL=1